MKQLKKADTFGQEDEWQIDQKQLKEIKSKITGEYQMYDEELDITLCVLAELGYCEWEKLMTIEEKYTHETGKAPKVCVTKGTSVAETFWYYTDDFVEWLKEE